MEEAIIYGEEDIDKYKFFENIRIDSFFDFNVDLALFSNLKSLKCDYNKISNLNSAKNLESLYIGGYKEDSNDLSNLKKLNTLMLSGGNVSNLDFLKDMSNMKSLYLVYLYKLKDVSMLVSIADTLDYLEIHGCKNIEWKGELSKLVNIRKIIFESKFQFDDLSWTKNLHKLEHLALGDSLVKDGNFDLVKNIEYVFMVNKRHYNYKFDYKKMKIVPK